MDKRHHLLVGTAYHKTSVLALRIRSILAHWRSSAVYGDPDPSHWVAPFQLTRIRGSSEAIIHAAIFGRKGATDASHMPPERKRGLPRVQPVKGLHGIANLVLNI